MTSPRYSFNPDTGLMEYEDDFTLDDLNPGRTGTNPFADWVDEEKGVGGGRSYTSVGVDPSTLWDPTKGINWDQLKKFITSPQGIAGLGGAALGFLDRPKPSGGGTTMAYPGAAQLTRKMVQGPYGPLAEYTGVGGGAPDYTRFTAPKVEFPTVAPSPAPSPGGGLSVQAKVDLYKKLRGYGLSDERVRRIAETMFGPQTDSDWAELTKRAGPAAEGIAGGTRGGDAGSGSGSRSGFTRDPNAIGASVITPWYNKKTGQTYMASDRAWNPPSADWVQGEPPQGVSNSPRLQVTKDSSAAEKAQEYRRLLGMGMSDAQIRMLAENTIGPQTNSDWQALLNLAMPSATPTSAPTSQQTTSLSTAKPQSTTGFASASQGAQTPLFAFMEAATNAPTISSLPELLDFGKRYSPEVSASINKFLTSSAAGQLTPEQQATQKGLTERFQGNGPDPIVSGFSPELKSLVASQLAGEQQLASQNIISPAGSSYDQWTTRMRLDPTSKSTIDQYLKAVDTQNAFGNQQTQQTNLQDLFGKYMQAMNAGDRSSAASYQTRGMQAGANLWNIAQQYDPNLESTLYKKFYTPEGQPTTSFGGYGGNLDLGRWFTPGSSGWSGLKGEAQQLGMTPEQIAYALGQDVQSVKKNIGLASGGITQGYAHGGRVQMEDGGFVMTKRAVDGAGGPRGIQQLVPGARMVRGPGTGTSDDIPAVINGSKGQTPARLSNGEAYVPRRFVQAQGGPQRMYSLMNKLQRKA